jgi:hypothetical protein
MISRAIVLLSPMSEPTSMPSHSPPLGRLGAPRIDHHHLGAVVDALEDVMEEDRMRRSRIRSPQEDQIGVLDLLV